MERYVLFENWLPVISEKEQQRIDAPPYCGYRPISPIRQIYQERSTTPQRKISADTAR